MQTYMHIQTDRQRDRQARWGPGRGPGPRPQPSQAGRQAGRQTNRQTDSTYITIHYTTFHSIPLRCITLHTWCAPSLGHFFGMRTTFGDIPCPCPDLGGWVWTLSIQHCPSGDRGGGSGIGWQWLRCADHRCVGRVRFANRVWVLTRAPASRHTLAAARSSGPPRLRSTSDWAPFVHGDFRPWFRNFNAPIAAAGIGFLQGLSRRHLFVCSSNQPFPRQLAETSRILSPTLTRALTVMQGLCII